MLKCFKNGLVASKRIFWCQSEKTVKIELSPSFQNCFSGFWRPKKYPRFFQLHFSFSFCVDWCPEDCFLFFFFKAFSLNGRHTQIKEKNKNPCSSSQRFLTKMFRGFQSRKTSFLFQLPLFSSSDPLNPRNLVFHLPFFSLNGNPKTQIFWIDVFLACVGLLQKLSPFFLNFSMENAFTRQVFGPILPNPCQKISEGTRFSDVKRETGKVYRILEP